MIILLLLVIVWVLIYRFRLFGILGIVFVPDVAKDHGVFFFRGQHVPEVTNIQCHVPKYLNSNFRLYKNRGRTLQLHLPRIAESYLKSYHYFSWSRNSPHFMKPGGSLPCSQHPTACPCPEPCEPIFLFHPISFEIHYNTIFSSMLPSSKVLSLWFFPSKSLMFISVLSLPFCPTYPIVFDLMN